MQQILKLDSSGQPHDWINWEDAVVYHAKGLVLWSLGESEYVFRGGMNRYSGQQSIIKTSPIIAVRGESARRKHRQPPVENEILFRRDLYRCAYCALKFKPRELTRDHIFPRSKGGLDNWMNVVSACKPCNNRKDDKTLAQSGMELAYGPYTPSWAEYLILKNNRISYEQSNFLLAFVPDKSRVRESV